jgi:hypothetical protein
MRMVLFDFDFGNEMLLNRGKCHYLERMKQAELRAEGGN